MILGVEFIRWENESSTCFPHLKHSSLASTQQIFSNSLITREDKITKITTVKEVWKCDLNYYKIFALNFSKKWSSTFSKEFAFEFLLKVGQKNSAAPRFFNPRFCVCKSDETFLLRV